MKIYFAFIFILTLLVNIQAQTTYLNVNRITFYDGRGNEIKHQREYNMVIKVSDVNLIISGGITFWFYGRVTRVNSTTLSQMARPDDGSGNCEVLINNAVSHGVRVVIRWTNMIVAYDCDY